ncbi:MAG: hypothetical protein Q8Q28_13280 [Pseudomonadota bacterium]|nr:hypothetical protein [Pseudomonadota bacterium]
MNENRLPDYLDHMIEAAQQVWAFFELLWLPAILEAAGNVPGT